jgi:hypothetical protein
MEGAEEVMANLGRYTAFFNEMQKIAAKQAVITKPPISAPVAPLATKPTALQRAIKMYKKSPVKPYFSKGFKGLSIGGKF